MNLIVNNAYDENLLPFMWRQQNTNEQDRAEIRALAQGRK